MDGFGGMMAIELAGGARGAEKFLRKLKVFRHAPSLGGVDSILESRARWEGDRVPAGLLRLSVGLEPVEDLWHDLANALKFPGDFSDA